MIPPIPPSYPFTAAGLAMARAATAAAQKTLLGIDTIQYSIPTTGQTVASDGSTMLAIDPAGTLLALTVTLPASPTDGQLLNIATTQAITTLTIGGGTIIGTLTTMSLGGFASFRFGVTAGIWFRVG